MIVSSERLHTFSVFAEDHNLSRTAKRLHLSQPAVHAQLKLLSEELEVPLYRRVGRGLVPTKEGIEVLAFARELAQRTADLKQRLSGEAGPRSVTLAAGAGALVHLLAPGLRAFAQAHGRGRTGPRIEVVTTEAAPAVDLVRRGGADVGVGVLASPPTDLEHHTLARARQVVVMPRTHPLARARTLKLGNLEGEALVVPPEGGPQRAAIDAVLDAAGIRVHVAAVARGWDVVLKLVELDVGIGIVNDTCTIPRTLVARPLREMPRVTYRAFHRPRPRPDVVGLVEVLLANRSHGRRGK